jgi:16S rRNA (guanine966-N2)-methyltransferase
MAGADVSRIIAGSRGGRRLATLPGDATRPTSDRVREALFSSIAAWAGTAAASAAEALSGLSFCDLYAGSGAVGLEAASRGAAPVLLVEGSRRAALVASRNVVDLGLAAIVRGEKVERLAQGSPPHSFDVIFLDPPYALDSGALQTIISDLIAHAGIPPGGLIIAERSGRSPPLSWPPGFDQGWTRHYGETTLQFGCG